MSQTLMHSACEMTYIVSGGAFNSTRALTHLEQNEKK